LLRSTRTRRKIAKSLSLAFSRHNQLRLKFKIIIAEHKKTRICCYKKSHV
jgi:hypothetical protein